MALPESIGDREFQKFEENGAGDVAVRIQPQKPDSMTGAFTVVDYAHHEVHGGSYFEAQAVDTSMADTDTLTLSFKTPTGTKKAHLVVEFSTLTGGYVEIIEGPTWDNQSGTKVPIYNRNRESSNTSILLEDQGQVAFIASENVIANVTTLAGGSAVHTVYAFSAVGKGTVGGRGDVEWILNPDTQYCVCFTSTAANNKAQLILEWYEHTDVA